MTHLEDAFTAIAAATTQTDLNAVYATHITRLILNGESREDLIAVAGAWQDRSLELLKGAMGDQP